MAVFVDLDDESEPPEVQPGNGSLNGTGTGNGAPGWGDARDPHRHAAALRTRELRGMEGKGVVAPQAEGEGDDDDDGRPNPNRNVITQALGCYPVIVSIASHIDLNTLDALAITCRQIRANLLQFRTQLLASTLHCSNEDVQPDPEHTIRYRARAADWYFLDAVGGAHGSAGKVGDCARDMVGGCRRCGTIVCRNCTIKPPAPVLLRHRHRRICKSCSTAPLAWLVEPSPHVDVSSSRASLPAPSAVAAETLKQVVCTCPSAGVWLCQPCGRGLRSADTEYESIWKWRTRYLPSLGGLGVGIGEGDRGVPCGRGGECVGAHEVEQETDCDAEDAREFDSSGPRSSSPPSSSSSSSSASSPGSASSAASLSHGQMGPGYARHEIEGIGGVVKRKLVRMVKVGAGVPEFGDEKEMGKFLVREVDGRARSWCGWCWRVIPGLEDNAQLHDS